MKIYVVVPAYNEARTIKNVILGLRKEGFRNIVVVSDGSRDNTADVARKSGATVLVHVINQGAGAATITGFEYAISKGAEVIVTLDADGQHDVRDVRKVLKPVVTRKADVCIGSRLINPKGMPFIRKFGNTLLNYLTFALFGVFTTDSQSGFKAMTADAYKKMNLNSRNFEICSEIVKEIGRNHLRFVEVPIRVIYTDYSMSKGQSITNGIKTFIAMLKRRFLT